MLQTSSSFHLSISISCFILFCLLRRYSSSSLFLPKESFAPAHSTPNFLFLSPPHLQLQLFYFPFAFAVLHHLYFPPNNPLSLLILLQTSSFFHLPNSSVNILFSFPPPLLFFLVFSIPLQTILCHRSQYFQFPIPFTSPSPASLSFVFPRRYCSSFSSLFLCKQSSPLPLLVLF